MRTKLAAFTLLETSVVMVITGLVVSIAWMVYERVGQESGRYRAQVTHDVMVSDVQARMVQDVAEANAIFCTPYGWRTERLGKVPIRWWSDEEALYRQQFSRIDTFDLAIQQTDLYWQRNPVLENGQRIDEIHLELDFAGQSLTLVAHKPAGAKLQLSDPKP